MRKKIFLAVTSLFFVILINAQKEIRVLEKVELKANTNEKALADHIRKKTQLPDSIKNIPAGTYIVNVQFMIDTHGNIGHVKVKNDPGYGLAIRAEYVISTYAGTWRPAIQCGRNVNANRTQPITFVIFAQ